MTENLGTEPTPVLNAPELAPTETDTDDTAEAHDEDVEECLKRETQDGSGLDEDNEATLPDSDLNEEEQE